MNENPTEGQKEAGNYKKAHVRLDGYDITIENKKGSTRSGVDPNGKAWSQEMHNDYGYILGTEGVDGDHIDMFLSDTPEQGDVFVVDQVNKDGSFDEHKVMYGFPDAESARQAYLSNYEEGWQGLGAITPVSKEEFKKWIDSSHRKTKPFSEYRSVETLGDVQVENRVNESDGLNRPTAEQSEIGGAMVDQLERMGFDVSTDIAENRRVRKQAEQDNSEEGKLRNYRTPDGKIYGFSYRGKIYLDPRRIDGELPIHEYAHPWCEAFRRLNPEGWQEVVDMLQGDAETWSLVQSMNPDLSSADDIAEEMIALGSGKKGRERAEAEYERMNAGGNFGNIWNNIAKAIQDFWKKLGDFLHIRYESSEQVYDQVVKDFANKVNPRKRVEEYLQERDAEYLQAVENGDEARAKELFDAALRENIGNGITPYVAVGKYRGDMDRLARGVKSRDPKIVAEVADLMAPIIPEDAVLVPAPSHSGEATDMLDVANAIAERTGAPVANVLRGVERGSQREAKREGAPITSGEMGITMEGELPEGKTPVVIDNVVNSGNTAEACVRALGKGVVASLADAADRYRHVASLKSAKAVVRDKNGNVVPLSKRFELGGSGYLAKQKGEGAAVEFTPEEKATQKAVDEMLGGILGKDYVVDAEEGQRVLEAERSRVTLQKRIDALSAAETFIEESLKGKHRGQRFEVELPKATENKVRRVMGRDFGSHNIYADGIVHSKNNHGENGKKIDENSIPLRDEDFGLAPYIMVAPDRVTKGSMGTDGRESIRFEKKLSNGVVLVVEKEQKDSPDDMDTITMWADLSSRVSDARFEKRPLSSTSTPANNDLETNSEQSNAVTVITSFDAAKIRKDAETAIEKDEKIKFHKADDGSYEPDVKPVYYSNAAKAVEGIKQEKATPEQWLKMIEKAGGLKAGEDKWIGLSEWLKDSDKKSLTKQEVLDYIKENQIEIEEVGYAENEEDALYLERKAEFKRYFDEAVENGEEEPQDVAWERMIDKYGDDFELAYWAAGDQLMRDNDSDYAQFEDENEGYPKPINETRLDYTTEGLDNKREIALVVPTVEPWNETDKVHFGDAGEGRTVAWVRFGETTDADGNRVLVIDEIQSKRHQEGREKGYANNKAVKAYNDWMKAKAKEKGAVSTYQVEARLTDEEYEEMKKLQEAAKIGEGIPDAPFDKNWHEVAMKRMLRYAAENGYDKVAWTTGEQQADRYDLGNKISDISVSKLDDGTRLVTLNFRNRAEQYDDFYQFSVNDEGRVVSGDFADKELSDVVGKDMSKKIMSADQPSTKFSGEDLRVGADGMKGFYDQILPRFMDKYGKKWGTKTSEVQLPNIGDNGLTMWSVDVTPEMKKSVMEGQPMFFKGEDGEVLGYTLNGKVYIDPRVATTETRIHEYSHLWAQALRNANPKAWEQLKSEMMSLTDLVDYVRNKYPELDGANGLNGSNEVSDEFVEEVFAHYSGKRGAERLESDMREAMAAEPDLVEKAGIANMFHKLREILSKFWTMARDLFAGKVRGVKKLTAEDFADMTLNDLLNGFDPREEGTKTKTKTKTENEKRDAEYMAAVERGDMETAQRMVDEAAKEAGYTIKGYHGTGSYGFTTFKEREAWNYDTDSVEGVGIFFSSDKANSKGYEDTETAEELGFKNTKEGTYSVFLKLENPLVVDFDGAWWNGSKWTYEVKDESGKTIKTLVDRREAEQFANEYEKENGGKFSIENVRVWSGLKRVNQYVSEAKQKGYDGVIFKNIRDSHISNHDAQPATTYAVFSSNQIKSADPVTYDDEGNVIPLSKRFDKRNADIRFHKGGTYRTKDGVQLSMESLFEESNESGLNRSNRLNGQDESGDLTELRLRKLAPGETCLVERRYEENKMFSFTGKEKIESIDDVAYIFKNLEDAAVENVFVAMVKDGKPTIVHIGMGTYNQSVADYKLAFAAYASIKPDKVWMIHNHPSGVLKASAQDRNLLQEGEKIFGKDVMQDGIIIDTVSGLFGVFNSGFGQDEYYMPESEGKEIPIKTYEFSKQVFDPEWDPMDAFGIWDSQDVAEFVSSHRLGEHPKMSFIVTNHQGKVVGNFFLPWTKMSEIGKDITGASRELSSLVNLAGGTRGALYGNYEYDKNEKKALGNLIFAMKDLRTPLLDVIHIDNNDGLGYHSANDSGVMEPEGDWNGERRTENGEREVVETLGEKLHSDIEIIEDVEQAKGLTERQKKSKGWYDPVKRKVTVVLENNRDRDDAMATVFHETVQHKGMREMIGEERWGEFLDTVYGALEDELKSEVDRSTYEAFMNGLFGAENGERKAESEDEYIRERRRQVDELMARVADKMPEDMTDAEMTLWEKICTLVRKAIDKFLGDLKLPKWVRLGENEIRYMLWKSRERLEDEGYVGMAKDMVKREELGLNEAESDIRFRDGEEEEPVNPQSMSLKEKIAATAMQYARDHEEDKNARSLAIRAINASLADIRKAMGAQREYDRTTVKRVSDLVQVLMQYGWLDNLSKGEVKRLLSVVKNATGKEDTSKEVQTVMDIMVDNQLKRAEARLAEIESIKGSKVDAKGVEVQGALDPAGQTMMKAFKQARGWDAASVEQAIADAQEKIGSSNAAVAEEASNRFVGLTLAKEYIENIKDSKTEEQQLRQSIKDYDGPVEAKKEFVASVEDAIRQNKIERVEAYDDLMNKIGQRLQGSIEKALDFKEREVERIREIQHNANSDMEGRPSNEHYKPKFKDKFVNNSFVQFVFAPLATFDQMLRLIGSKSANGEGYLYNRFMRGWVDAREKEIRGVREKYAILDNKVKEIFGGKIGSMADLIRAEGKMPKMSVEIWNGGMMQPVELTQGNLMYIYMVNKMSDGRMKLRKMGVTEEDTDKIEAALDPRLKELADWIQDEFLVKTRNEYNETHKKVFGANMAAIEKYFPLKILANARVDKPEDLDNPDMNEGISTKTGSIIKRTLNALALDVTGADALNVVLDHVAQMEHWNAFAEFNKDLNTLRTYKRFRNQIQNMSTIYGSGKELWKKFNDVSQMAAGTYRPPRAKLDNAAVNFAKGVTAAKVSFRVFTALKQFLSSPAYLTEARPDYLAANLAAPWKAWKWAMENLPIFEERWKSKIAGDPRLMKSELDWKGWRNNVVQIASKIGMSPNAFVDALTVSIGAHSIYQTKKAQYLKDGYSEEQADRRAKQDAEVAYNQTQQSSEGPFTSTMQVDRSWLSVMFTVFRNASMSYTRQLWDAVRELKRNLTPGQRADSIEFMTKQLVRDGVDEEKAKQTAKRKFNRQMRKDAMRVAVFGYILQFAWNLGPYLPYLLMGDDDDEKQKMWDDVIAHSWFGWLEGFTGGDVASEAGKMIVQGEGNPEYLKKEMPLASDAYKVLRELGGGKYGEVVNDLVNLVVQMGLGMNPQSITDAVLAIMDVCGDDPALAHEAAIAVMRVLQFPQSQIEKIYFDEFGLQGDEISNYTPVQLAERYAKYKVKRGRFTTPWAWNDEAEISNQRQKAEGLIKERTERLGGKELNDAYATIRDEMQPIEEKIKEFKKAKKSDYVKAAKIMSEIQSDIEAYQKYQRFEQLDEQLDKIVEKYLKAKTAEDAERLKKEIVDKKKEIVELI